MAELSILLKVTAVLILGLGAAWLGDRQPAAVRSLILACTFGLLLLIPAASLMLPARAVELPATYSLAFADGRITVAAPSADLSTNAPDIAAAASPASEVPSISLRGAFLLLWAAGALAFLTPLVVGLHRLRRLRSHGRPWARSALPSSVDLLLHDEVRVPITFGIRRSVLALPADAPQWAESDLRRVLLHELEHVRRHDWLVHIATRTICAFYWFHPLVWITWRRLSLESERACDDAVLREEDGTAYAAQLVSLARRITKQNALPLLSIVGRSNLSLRVAAMLAGNVARGRVRSPTAMAIAAIVVIATLGIGPLRLAAAPSERALQPITSSQRTSGQSTTTGLAFESTSIRHHILSGDTGVCCLVKYSADGRVAGTNVDLVDLIVSAYGLYRWQVEGAAEDGSFDIQATARRNASPDDMHHMLQTMLADRFGLAVHRESRVQKVYELVVAPGGHKLAAPDDRNDFASEDIWMTVDPNTMIATLSTGSMTMAQLARNLGFPMGTLVIDRTGLKGAYRVNARWSAVPGSKEIFDAFPAQLGLRFREATAPVEYLIVDRTQRPQLNGP